MEHVNRNSSSAADKPYRPARPSAPRENGAFHEFFGYGKFKYKIFPGAGWDRKKWGDAPYLGTVYANDEFYAIRMAYSKNLAPLNYTFDLKAVKVDYDNSNNNNYTRKTNHE